MSQKATSSTQQRQPLFIGGIACRNSDAIYIHPSSTISYTKSGPYHRGSYHRSPVNWIALAPRLFAAFDTRICVKLNRRHCMVYSHVAKASVGWIAARGGCCSHQGIRPRCWARCNARHASLNQYATELFLTLFRQNLASGKRPDDETDLVLQQGLSCGGGHGLT